SIVTDLFVMPVHRNAILCHLVHITGADLNLRHAIIQAEDGGVQRLVAVGFGAGDEVLDAPVFRLPQLVDVSQHHVAVRHALHDDPERHNIEEIRDVATAGALHFAEYAVEVLDAPRHFRLNAKSGDLLAQDGANARHIRASLELFLGHGFAEPAI